MKIIYLLSFIVAISACTSGGGTDLSNQPMKCAFSEHFQCSDFYGSTEKITILMGNRASTGLEDITFDLDADKSCEVDREGASFVVTCIGPFEKGAAIYTPTISYTRNEVPGSTTGELALRIS